MQFLQAVLSNTYRDIRRGFRALFACGMLFRLIAGSLLGAVVTIVLNSLLALRGQDVLSDFEIAQFMLSPIGAVGTILCAAFVLAIFLLEISALFLIFRRIGMQAKVSFAQITAEVLRATPALLKLSLITVMALVSVLSPFGYLVVKHALPLVSEYDLNYYLAIRPPEFVKALAIAGACGLGALIALVLLFVPWLFAPCGILFDRVGVKTALRLSRQYSRGRFGIIFAPLLVWALGSIVLCMVGSWAGVFMARRLLFEAQGSLTATASLMGGMLLVNLIVSLLFSFLVFTSGTGLVFHLYLKLSGRAAPCSVGVEPRTAALYVSKAVIPAAVLVGLLFIAGASVWIPSLVARAPSAQIIAHRGSSFSAPENTLSAVRLAVTEQADMVEVDVQESSDGEIIVLHDKDLKRVAGRSESAWEMTAAAMSKIDIGSWFGREFAGEHVPTLREVIEIVRGRAALLVELKYNGHERDLARRVMRILKDSGVYLQSSIMSLDYAGILEVKRIDPQFDTGFLSNVSLSSLFGLNVDYLSVASKRATRRFIRNAHRNHLRVYVWTVNNPIEIALFLQRGVDGIITDRPALARAVATELNQLSALQRLLLLAAAYLGRPLEEAEQ